MDARWCEPSPAVGVDGWHLDADALRTIDALVRETVLDPVGPEFMAPPLQRPIP